LHDCRKQTALACADPHNLSMRPRFEQVTVARGQSWTLYDGQLPSCPFNWHYHPEFELTLTLNSIGERFVGDHVAHYGDGDLVLVGPNLPHAWQSRAAVDTGQPQRALVLWFTQQWAQGLTTPYPELSGIDPSCSPSRRAGSRSARPRSMRCDRGCWPPPLRWLGLLEVLLLLACDSLRQPLALQSFAANHPARHTPIAPPTGGLRTICTRVVG
jgi:hypothetical protein